MYKSKIIFLIVVSYLLLSFVSLSMAGCVHDEAAFHSFVESLKERRDSGWPIPDNMEDVVGVYKYSLTSEAVQKIGLSAITDISDCDALMELYEDGNGRIALYDERSKGPRPTSEAYDLEWYAEKIPPEDLNMDDHQDYSDFYRVQVAFYKHFDIEYVGGYIFMKYARDPYVYDNGKVRHENAEDWLITKNHDSDVDESLSISAIQLK